MDHAFLLVPAQQYVGQFLATFKEYPPPKGSEIHNRPGVGEITTVEWRLAGDLPVGTGLEGFVVFRAAGTVRALPICQ
jgi:hypothetical protein